MVKKMIIVVPAYNEEETLKYAHARLITTITPGIGRLFEECKILYVNDGSRDRTGEILTEIVDSYGLIQSAYLEFSKNFGHSAAVLAGLENGIGDLYCIIDADLQDPPELIIKMCEELLAGYDVVYGRRSVRHGETLFKRVTAWGFYRILNSITGIEFPRDTGDFRVMTREVRDAVLQCREHDPFLRGLVAWVGFRQKAFYYEREPRQFGETKYTFRKMSKFAVTAILAFSTRPMRAALYLGSAGLFISYGITAWALWQWFSGHTIQGWTSLLIFITFSQSLTLLMVGLVGLYVGNIHTAVQQRPRYLLKSGRSSATDLT